MAMVQVELEGDWSADTAGRMKDLFPSQLHQRALHAPWRPLAEPVSVTPARARVLGMPGTVSPGTPRAGATKSPATNGAFPSTSDSSVLTFRRLAPCARVIEFPQGRTLRSFGFFRAMQRIMAADSSTDVWGLSFRDSTLEKSFCDSFGEAVRVMPEVGLLAAARHAATE